MTDEGQLVSPGVIGYLPPTFVRRIFTFLSGKEEKGGKGGKKPRTSQGVEADIYGYESVTLLLVHLNLVVYSLCFWMQQPVLPFLVAELGIDDSGETSMGRTYGLLQSFVSVFSLIGGPLFGLLLDKYGPKTSLILCHFSSICMYFLISLSFSLKSLPILFLSQIPAIGQHVMLVSQASLTLVTSSSNRSAALGRLSLSYGIGMILGGPLGGLLKSLTSLGGSAFFAAMLSIALNLYNLYFFPDQPTPDPGSEGSKSKQKSSSLNVAKIIKLLKINSLRDVLICSSFVTFGLGCFRTVFSLISTTDYGFTSEILGLYMSFMALVGLISNVFLVNRVLEYFQHNYLHIFILSSVLMSFSYLFYIHVTSTVAVFLLSIPTGMVSSILYVLTTSLISLSVAPENKDEKQEKDEEVSGTAISLSHASRSFIGLISPVLGGIVYDNAGLQGAVYLVVLSNATMVLYLLLVGKESFMKLSKRRQP